MTQHVFPSKTKWRHQTVIFQLSNVQLNSAGLISQWLGCVTGFFFSFLFFFQITGNLKSQPTPTPRNAAQSQTRIITNESKHIEHVNVQQAFLLCFTYLYMLLNRLHFENTSGFFFVVFLKSVPGALANLCSQKVCWQVSTGKQRVSMNCSYRLLGFFFFSLIYLVSLQAKELLFNCKL